jgi:hypothetical protein
LADYCDRSTRPHRKDNRAKLGRKGSKSLAWSEPSGSRISFDNINVASYGGLLNLLEYSPAVLGRGDHGLGTERDEGLISDFHYDGDNDFALNRAQPMNWCLLTT